MLAILFRHLAMVRVTAATALVLAATACAGQITTPGGDSPELAAAKARFATDVKPILDGFCGSCHIGQANIDFMRPEPDVRGHIMAWPDLVDLVAPSQSQLLNKGAHTGPSLTPDQTSVFLAWVELEAVAAGGEPADTVATDRITPVQGVNTVDLEAIGLTGSTVTFLYEPLATGMYLSDIQVSAGTGGVHLVNPLFVIWDGETPMPDPINRFGNVDLVVQETQTSYVGGGTAVFVDIPPGAPISLEFRIATLADGTDPGGGPGGVVGGGCNNVPAFTSSAQPPIAAACASCHGGGNTDAVAATDMRKINDLTTEGQIAACAQIKTRVNDADPVNSGLFLAPDPNSGTQHPFTFPSATDSDNFRNQVILWINQE
jgi:cytochrome c553